MQGATRILWLTPQYLKDNSRVESNVQDNILQVSIRIAEDKYLHPLIGSQMTIKVNQLLNDFIISGQTIPPLYKTLIDDYILPCLVEYTLYEDAPNTFKFTNKGINRQTSPDSQPAGLTELTYIRSGILNNAQFYGERLIDFLRVGYTNASSFPEYTQAKAGDLTPAKGDYFNGIHIPKRNRDSGCFRPYTNNPYN